MEISAGGVAGSGDSVGTKKVSEVGVLRLVATMVVGRGTRKLELVAETTKLLPVVL